MEDGENGNDDLCGSGREDTFLEDTMRKVGLAAVLAVVASVLSTVVVQASPVAGGQYTGQIANPIDSRTAYVGQSVQLTRVNGAMRAGK